MQKKRIFLLSSPESFCFRRNRNLQKPKVWSRNRNFGFWINFRFRLCSTPNCGGASAPQHRRPKVSNSSTTRMWFEAVNIQWDSWDDWWEAFDLLPKVECQELHILIAEQGLESGKWLVKKRRSVKTQYGGAWRRWRREVMCGGGEGVNPWGGGFLKTYPWRLIGSELFLFVHLNNFHFYPRMKMKIGKLFSCCLHVIRAGTPKHVMLQK